MGSPGGQSTSSKARSLGFVIVLSRFGPGGETYYISPIICSSLTVRGQGFPANWDGPRQAWAHARGARHSASPERAPAGAGSVSARTPVPYLRTKIASCVPDTRLSEQICSRTLPTWPYYASQLAPALAPGGVAKNLRYESSTARRAMDFDTRVPLPPTTALIQASVAERPIALPPGD